MSQTCKSGMGRGHKDDSEMHSTAGSEISPCCDRGHCYISCVLFTFFFILACEESISARVMLYVYKLCFCPQPLLKFLTLVLNHCVSVFLKSVIFSSAV